MQKSFKMFFGVLICTVFSALTLSSASAKLSHDHKIVLKQLHSQYTTDPSNLCDWRKKVLHHLVDIGNSSPTDQSLAGQAFIYLVSKITGNKLLKHLDVWDYVITHSYTGNKINSLECSIITTFSKEIKMKI